jgi:hypothetical protein
VRVVGKKQIKECASFHREALLIAAFLADQHHGQFTALLIHLRSGPAVFI